MTTAIQKLDYLIDNLNNTKSDSKLRLPLIGDLTLLRNQQMDDAAKEKRMQEIVLIAYGKEYAHTRTKAMIGSGSKYSSLTTAMNGFLLDDVLERTFQGQAKPGGAEGKHQDTVIFNSAKDPHPIVQALFSDALIDGFLDDKNGKQAFVNAMKAIRGMGYEAINAWNELATASVSPVPTELLFSADSNARSESNFKAQYDKLNNNATFKNAVVNADLPSALNHFLQEVPSLREPMQKQIKIYQSNPANYDINKMHAIITKAYLHEYLDNRSKGTFTTVESPELKRFETLIHDFTVKSGSTFLSVSEKGLDFIEPSKASYDSIARSVKSPEELEDLVDEAFERTVKLFMAPDAASKFVFINSQKFVQALGPEAIKTWNLKVTRLDSDNDVIFPNLMMDRQSNNEVTIKSRWDSLMEKDAVDLKEIMTRPMRAVAAASPFPSSTKHAGPGLFSPASITRQEAKSPTPPSPYSPDSPPPLLSSLPINKKPS